MNFIIAIVSVIIIKKIVKKISIRKTHKRVGGAEQKNGEIEEEEDAE